MGTEEGLGGTRRTGGRRNCSQDVKKKIKDRFVGLEGAEHFVCLLVSLEEQSSL